MKIRVIGTREECKQAKTYYEGLRSEHNVKYVCVSGFYSCRGSADLYRIYIEVEYFDYIEADAEGSTRKLPKGATA